MEQPKLVCDFTRISNSQSNIFQQLFSIVTKLRQSTPNGEKVETHGCALLERQGTPEAVSESTTRVLQAAWRPSTHAKYKCLQGKWNAFCSEAKADHFDPGINLVLKFLTFYFDKGHSYKSIASYLSIVRKNVVLTEKDNLLLKRFMKGVYNLRPPVKKHMATWDVCILLNHLRNMRIVTPMDISKKLSSLFMILAGTRVNSLFHMVITNFYLTDSECTFTFDSVLKHSRQGFDASPITFRAFPQEPDLCPVITAKIYLKYRLTISSDIGFFVATTKPHGAASSSTIARWITVTSSL